MCHQELRKLNTSNTTKPSSDPQKRVITWKELALHNRIDDAWIAIKGKVYDVTNFAKRHPGGDIIFTVAGSDATDVYAGFHASTDSWRLLPPLCVGQIDQPNSPPYDGVSEEYVRDVLNMRKQIQELRLFNSSKLYYCYKLLSNISICTLSILIATNMTSWSALFVAAFLMALFWQQCGWLAHDFLHHQVFTNRQFNNAVGLLVGNIFQGYSVAWWKNKHNHHHAVPNVTDTPAGGDPDIATMPILFWSEKVFEGEKLDDLPKWMLRNQGVLYFPILCMARISWLMQSFLYQLPTPNPHVTSKRMYYTEVITLIIHHIWWLAVVLQVCLNSSVVKGIAFAAAAQALGGVLLGVVFAVGHNAMDVLTYEEMRAVDFIRLQVRTSRNVDPNWFSNWFTGGLNYQVEHHIFPTVPRHHLPAVAKMLREFCLKHSIPYTSETLLEGNKAVCHILHTVSKAA